MWRFVVFQGDDTAEKLRSLLRKEGAEFEAQLEDADAQRWVFYIHPSSPNGTLTRLLDQARNTS